MSWRWVESTWAVVVEIEIADIRETIEAGVERLAISLGVCVVLGADSLGVGKNDGMDTLRTKRQRGRDAETSECGRCDTCCQSLRMSEDDSKTRRWTQRMSVNVEWSTGWRGLDRDVASSEDLFQGRQTRGV